MACWLFTTGCRLNYETFDTNTQASTGATSGASGSSGPSGGSAGSGSSDQGGLDSGGAPSLGNGGDGTTEPSAGAPTTIGADPGAECDSADDCASGACVAGVCEGTGLGSGTLVTFGHSDSDHNDVAADTWISDWGPDDINENYGFLVVEQSDTGTAVTLIRFDLSAMPAGVTITGAQLRIDVFMDPSMMGSITIHEQLEPRTDWETTWNERALGVPWTTPGCGVGSRSADALGRFAPLENQTYDVPLAPSVVQHWLDDPSSNYGIVLVGDGTDFVNFRPAGVGTGVKPQLAISYE